MPVSELRSVLTNDNKQFVQSMKQSVAVGKNSGKEIAKAFSPVGAAMGGIKSQFAGLFAVGAVTAGIRSVGQFASEIRDLSDTVNMGAEEFQRYSFAVSQSGGSQELFVKSLIGIQEKQQEAVTGNEKAIGTFARLGISVEDLRKTSPSELFLLISDEMKRTNGSAETFAQLAELIGVKVATKMVPSLKMGSEEFRQLGASATVASQNVIDGVEAAQDSWDKFVLSIKTGALIAFDAMGDIGGEQSAARLAAATKKFDNTPRTPSPIPGDSGAAAPAVPETPTGFWKKELPKMTKPTRDMNISTAGTFAGFGSGYFPTSSGGLMGASLNERGYSGLNPGYGLGGAGSAYGKVRAGDKARRAAEAKAGGKDPVITVMEKVVTNTAALADGWGVQGATR